MLKTLKCSENARLAPPPSEKWYKKFLKSGFSLVELIVVIAIMAVMAAVLVPSLLKYTESSRKSKDEHSVDELANAVQLALADSKIYDELVQYSAHNNVSCYIDTKTEADHQANKIWTKKDTVDSNKGEYTFSPDARLLDETRYIAAGNMRGVTITWHPNEKQKYTVSDGIINKWMSKKGKIADTKTLLSRVESTVGKELGLSSQTYRNSDYTLFIGLNSTGGKVGSAQNAIKIYGQFDGTNLPMADINFEKTPDRLTDVNIKEEYPFMDDKTPVYDEDDLVGGGNTGGGGTINPPAPDKPTKPGETDPPGESGSGGGQTGPEKPTEPGGGTVKPDPLKGKAYVFYSETDQSLNFLRSEVPLEQNGTYDGKTIDKIYNIDIETTPFEIKNGKDIYKIESNVPWISKVVQQYSRDIYFYDTIKPISTAGWFYNMNINNVYGAEKFDTSAVTNMDYMFGRTGMRDKALSLITTLNTSNCTSMQDMFFLYGNDSNRLDISNFMTKNVTNMAEMFRESGIKECVGLKDLDVQSCKTMWGMFQFSSFQHIDLSGWKNNNIKEAAYAFYGCSAVTVNLSSFKRGPNLSMAFHCSNLTTVYVSSDWVNTTDRFSGVFDAPKLVGENGTKCNIRDGNTTIAAAGYAQWAVIDTPETPGYFTSYPQQPKDYSMLRIGGTWFDESKVQKSSVKAIKTVKELPKTKEEFTTWWDASRYKKETVIAAFDATDGTLYLDAINNDYVTAHEDSSYAFGAGSYYSAGFKNVEFLDFTYLKTDKTTNMGNMFSYLGYSAKSFKIVGLSNWNVSNVTNASYMFCYTGYSATTWSIGELTNWNVSSLTHTNFMFHKTGENASSFYIGDLSKWDVASVTDMMGMFSYSGSSSEIFDIGNLSQWNVSNVTDMSWMFESAGQDATEWSIGNLSNWNVSSVTKMSKMFKNAGWSATTWSVGDLGSWNVSNVTIMQEMFQGAGFRSTWSQDLSKWNVAKVTSKSYFQSQNKIVEPKWAT